MSRHMPFALIGTGLIAIAASAADAQSVQPPTREELDRLRPATPLPGPARVTVDDGIERAPCPLADPRFADVTITIRQVDFAAPSGLALDLLTPSWQAWRDRTVPIATVCEIRDAAATALRRAGYLAAVQVPPQRIENGVVRFDILAARVTRIEVRGDPGPADGLIAGYLEPIREQPLLNLRDAERYLLLARDIPGYDVRLTLRPAGAGPGEVIGEVTVTRQRYELDANIQNYGSRDIGRFGGLLRARLFGLTGLGDATTLGVFSTSDVDEQQVVQIAHELRIGRQGLTIGGDFNYAWSTPSFGLAQPIRSETLIATLRASYPLQRAQAGNVLISGGFDIVDQETRFGSTPISNDSLRALWLRLDLDRTDPVSLGRNPLFSAAEPRWRTAASLEIRQGIGILGASKPCTADILACLAAGTPPSRIEADPTAFVIRASASGEWRPVPRIAFSLAPRIQYAPHPLLSFEEFSAGNYTVGRGYDPGQILGDTGFAVAGEVKLGSVIPASRRSLAVQPFAFFDAAWVRNHDSAFAGQNPQSLYSTGGGVRAAWGDHMRADLAVAVPLKRAGLQSERGAVRVLFSITARLLPWS